MTSRPPSPVRTFNDDTLEKTAYTSVESVPVREPNDHARLGYHVWLYLTGKIPSLQEAIRTARTRLLIAEDEAGEIIAKNLKERGIK